MKYNIFMPIYLNFYSEVFSFNKFVMLDERLVYGDIKFKNTVVTSINGESFATKAFTRAKVAVGIV